MKLQITDEVREKIRNGPQIIPVGFGTPNTRCFTYLKVNVDDTVGSSLIFRPAEVPPKLMNETYLQIINSLNHLLAWVNVKESTKDFATIFSVFQELYFRLDEVSIDQHIIQVIKDKGDKIDIEGVRRAYIIDIVKTAFASKAFNEVIIRYVDDVLVLTNDISFERKTLMRITHVLSIYSKVVAFIVPRSKAVTRAVSEDIISMTENYILDEPGNEDKSFPAYTDSMVETYLTSKIKTEYGITPATISDMISEMLSTMFRFRLLKFDDVTSDDMLPGCIYSVDENFLMNYIYSEYQNDKYLHSSCKAMIRNELCRNDGGAKGGN